MDGLIVLPQSESWCKERLEEVLVPPNLDDDEGVYTLVADRELVIFQSASTEKFEGVGESRRLHAVIGVFVERRRCTEDGRERESADKEKSAERRLVRFRHRGEDPS